MKEALAVVRSVKHFQKYLLHEETIVFTDNSAVASILNSKEPNGRILRWINYLGSFNLLLKDRSGISAYYVSRFPILSCTGSFNTVQQIMRIKRGLMETDKQIASKAMRTLSQFTLSGDTLFRIHKNNYLNVIETEKQLLYIFHFIHDNLGHGSLQATYIFGSLLVSGALNYIQIFETIFQPASLAN